MIERQRYRCYLCPRETRLVVIYTSYIHVGDEHPDDLVGLCHRCWWKVRQDQDEAARLFRPCGAL